jgi:uncharacterized membrane protein YkoI
MNRRLTIAALAAIALTGLGALAAPASARGCGARCVLLAQDDAERDNRLPYLRGPARDHYGGPGERARTRPPDRGAREPLADTQIWAIAKSRVPGRIVNARLHGHAYSFRIISNRGSIVDVVVDRYSGRILSVRGGP